MLCLKTCAIMSLRTAQLNFKSILKVACIFLRTNAEINLNKGTNNKCESINHALKQYVQWKPQQLPDLMAKLRQQLLAQQVKADRAIIIGRDDFMLNSQHTRYRFSPEACLAMSTKQRKIASNSCFRLQSAFSSVTSSDGLLSVRLTPGSGKKTQPKEMYERRSNKQHETTAKG